MRSISSALSRYSGAATARLRRHTTIANARAPTMVNEANPVAREPGPIHLAHIAAIDTLSLFRRFGVVEVLSVRSHSPSRSTLPLQPYTTDGSSRPMATTPAAVVAAGQRWV